MNFYTRFAINTALSLVATLVATKGKLSDIQRTRALALIQSGSDFMNSMGGQ